MTETEYVIALVADTEQVTSVARYMPDRHAVEHNLKQDAPLPGDEE